MPQRRKWTNAQLAAIEHRKTISAFVPVERTEPGGIFALDLSSSVGWAYGRVDDVQPLTGVWLLPRDKPHGARFAAYENELIDALARFQPGEVIMEAPMRLKAAATRSEAAARHQIGLAAYTEGEWWRHAGQPTYEADVNAVRLNVLGQCRWPSRDEVKPAIVSWCRDMGWNITDHNAGDAAVLWWYRRCMLLDSRSRRRAA